MDNEQKTTWTQKINEIPVKYDRINEQITENHMDTKINEAT